MIVSKVINRDFYFIDLCRKLNEVATVVPYKWMDSGDR